MPFHIRAIARHTEKPKEVLQARLLYWRYKEIEKLATLDILHADDISNVLFSSLYIAPKLDFYTLYWN